MDCAVSVPHDIHHSLSNNGEFRECSEFFFLLLSHKGLCLTLLVSSSSFLSSEKETLARATAERHVYFWVGDRETQSLFPVIV